MKEISEFENKIFLADSLEILKEIPDNSIDLIITDPPYMISSETVIRRQRNPVKFKNDNKEWKYKGKDISFKFNFDQFNSLNDVPLLYLVPYNGQTIQCPHLHLYVEGYMDKWAIPAPANEFLNTKDLYQTLEDFFRYCNIIEPPIIQRGLFA